MNEIANENVEQQQRDSDMIFTQITTGDFQNFAEAESAICMLHVPDMSDIKIWYQSCT